MTKINLPNHASPTLHEPFLLLDENRLAHAALQRLRSNSRVPAASATGGREPRAPGLARAPLVYVYGPAGVGKSHLVRQFIREERRHSPDLKIAHVTASQFAAELAEASAEDRVAEFQERYRKLDFLACDDLGSLRKRHESQRQFVAAIDEVMNSGGCVILTGRTLAGELTGLLPRLVNRCHGGVSAAMILPGPASRASLLMQFARVRQIALTKEAIGMLAERMAVPPRELLAAVIQIDAAARLEQVSLIGVSFAERFLAGDVRPELKLSQIARAVARHFDVTVATIRSPNRQHGQILPRQCAMLLARELTKEPLVSIARYFGRRNHSTVIHACQRLHRLLDDEPALRRHVGQIRQTLSGP